MAIPTNKSIKAVSYNGTNIPVASSSLVSTVNCTKSGASGSYYTALAVPYPSNFTSYTNWMVIINSGLTQPDSQNSQLIENIMIQSDDNCRLTVAVSSSNTLTLFTLPGSLQDLSGFAGVNVTIGANGLAIASSTTPFAGTGVNYTATWVCW